MSESLQPHGLYSPPGSSVYGILQARIRVSCHARHGMFSAQGLNLHLLCLWHWQAGSLPLAPPGFCINYIYLEPRTEKAPHSSTLAWKIPWTEGPGRLQSMGSRRVGHDWALSDFAFTFHFHALEKEMATHSSVLAWRIPGMGEPGGCCLWGRTESDMTEAI